MNKYCSTINKTFQIGSALKLFLLIILILLISSCNKLVEVNPPQNALSGATVYQSDATAISAITYLYAKLSATSSYYNGFTNLSLYAGLSADELTLYDQANVRLRSYYRNSLSINTAGYESWIDLYPYLYSCNFAIEEMSKSNTLTPSVKQQLLGESKFVRAFFYFYLVNLYGDIPLALDPDYKTNSLLGRTPRSEVYLQIINDLKDAINLLQVDYLNASLLKTSKERIRPTKGAARALLARTYLYTGDWVNAEEQATAVINSQLYTLTDLNGAFLKNSNEAIWQLQPVTSNITNTHDALIFIIPSTGPSNSWPVYLSNHIINSFEADDQRKVNWVGKFVDSSVTPHITYNYPYKYKVNTPNAPVTEYIMMLRLAEQYLIRAEARAQQNKIESAKSDLNTIRTRASLPATSSNDKSSLLNSILHERKVELFTELGQRWLDLKRTNKINDTMSIVTPQKGGTWENSDQLYPIPIGDIQKNPNLNQNTGY